MKKSRAYLFTLIVISLILIFLSSYTYVMPSFSLKITHNEKVVLHKEYQIPIKTLFVVNFKFNGNYYSYFKSKNGQSVKEKLDSLAPNLYEDIMSLKKIEYAPTNASYKWNEETASFIYSKEKYGLLMDEKEIMYNLFATFNKNMDLKLPVKKIAPDITTLDVKAQTELRGFFSTNYSSSSPTRKHNIALAAERLNGKIIPPKTKFSFNKIVGERTEENGFKRGLIIFNGEYIPGTGGGVCQVSTTFYSACLRAGLDIDYVKPHSLLVSYIKPSFDAMVSSTNDLVIYNQSDYPFFIKAEADGKELKFSIFGSDLLDKKNLEIKSKIEFVIENNEYEEIVDTEGKLKPGESQIIKYAKPGYISSAYAYYYRDGKLIETKKLRHDFYSAEKGKILIHALDKKKLEEIQPKNSNSNFPKLILRNT